MTVDDSPLDRDGAEQMAPSASSRRRDRRRWTLLGAGLILLLALGALAIVGVTLANRALDAKNSLEHAQRLVSKLQTAITDDPATASGIAAEIASDTASARERTDGSLWRFGESVPGIGKNLTVVRELAVAVDDVADGALAPLASIASTIDVASLKPVDGRINLQPIVDARETVESADDALQTALTAVTDIDTAGAYDELAQAQSKLAGLLEDAAGTTATARVATQIIPSLLGSDGPRSYLLMFQNNAEARSLGGNVASLLLLSVDNGAISIAQQASSADFPRDAEPPIAIDPNISTVYYPKFTRYVQDVATRPDFPFTAQLGKGWWESVFGGHIDGVISFDPVALASLIEATGPIDLPTGEKLTSENTVRLLLSDAYVNYPDPEDSDAFFASAASSIFGALTSGGTDPEKLLSALSTAADEGRFMAWSEKPDEQKLIETLPIAGVLPTTNDITTTAGVYFDDQSSSKIDYWFDSAVDFTADYCTTPSAPVFSVTYTLQYLLDQAQSEALPSYVAAGFLPRGQSLTDIYVLGPPGSAYLDSTVSTPGISNGVTSTGTDLGRPIVRMSTQLGALQSTTVTVRFTGAEDEYGPLAVRTTPMVNDTVVTMEQPPACAAG